MPTLPEATFPDESPTAPTAHTPGKLLAFATRVERLTEDALDRIRSGAPSDAAAYLVQLQALTGSVLR